MPSQLYNSPAEILGQALVDAGQGFDPATLTSQAPVDWSVFVGDEPTIPDNCLTVYNTTPQGDGRSMPDGQGLYHRGLTIRVRATRPDTCARKSYALETFLNEKIYQQSVTIGDYSYRIHCAAKVRVVDMNKNKPQTKRNLFNINLVLALYPLY